MDWTDWQKIPEKYTVALNRVYEYISPPICCDGAGSCGRDSVGGEAGAAGGCGIGCGGRLGKCRVNFDEKWSSMLRGFYSLLRRIVPAAQQTAEMISALRAAFLDLTENIFHVGMDQPPPPPPPPTTKNKKSIIFKADEGGRGSDESRDEVEENEMQKEEEKESFDEEIKALAALGIQKSVKGEWNRIRPDKKLSFVFCF